jgi:dynein light chain LC8-type
LIEVVLKLYPNLKTKQSEFAKQLKSDLDETFGGPWHVIIGKSFSSSISHEKNGFAYFYIDNLAFLCFKTA